MSSGLMLLNPIPQGVKAVRSSFYLGFKVVVEEAFSSSEKMNLIHKPLKSWVLSNEKCVSRY